MEVSGQPHASAAVTPHAKSSYYQVRRRLEGC